jgi:hypothetical protein
LVSLAVWHSGCALTTRVVFPELPYPVVLRESNPVNGSSTVAEGQAAQAGGCVFRKLRSRRFVKVMYRHVKELAHCCIKLLHVVLATCSSYLALAGDSAAFCLTTISVAIKKVRTRVRPTSCLHGFGLWRPSQRYNTSVVFSIIHLTNSLPLLNMYMSRCPTRCHLKNFHGVVLPCSAAFQCPMYASMF